MSSGFFPPRPPSRPAIYAYEPWKESGKYVVNLAAPAKRITPIKLVPKGRVKALQNLRYTALSRLAKAKTLDDVW